MPSKTLAPDGRLSTMYRIGVLFTSMRTGVLLGSRCPTGVSVTALGRSAKNAASAPATTTPPMTQPALPFFGGSSASSVDSSADAFMPLINPLCSSVPGAMVSPRPRATDWPGAWLAPEGRFCTRARASLEAVGSKSSRPLMLLLWSMRSKWTSLSSSINSMAEPRRLSASLTSARLMMSARASGTLSSGCVWRMSGGGFDACAIITAIGVAPSKGGFPVSSS